jgi:hypothetical protein
MSSEPVIDRDDLLTVIAIAVLAACTSDIAHEVIGHGSACVVSGQHVLLLNNAFFKCSGFGRYTALAGPLGNLAAGLIAVAAQGLISVRRPSLRLYALLVMAFSLFWEAGYLIQAMIKDSGDSVFAYRELIGTETLVVRAVAVLLGAMAYVLVARMLRRRLAVFATAPGRSGRLCRLSWVTGVAAMVSAGALFAPDRLGAAHDAGLSIAASFPLLFAGRLVRVAPEAAATIVRSPAITVLAVTVFLAFALSMGRGIMF